ncbi:MAG: hypothetical protein JSR17_06995 [Proteobacteria bacterium]|nr:hypothetical protein [Pseudomonadota bacterium]
MARVSKKFKEQTHTNKEMYRNIAKKYFRHFLEEDWKQEFDADPRKVILDYLKKHSNDLAAFSKTKDKNYIKKRWLQICAGEKDIVKNKYSKNYMNPRVYTIAMGNFIDMIGGLNNTEFSFLAKKLIEDRNLKLVKHLFETQMHKQRAQMIFRSILLNENINLLAKNAPHLLVYLLRYFQHDAVLLDHIFNRLMVTNQHDFMQLILKVQPEHTISRINKMISDQPASFICSVCMHSSLEQVELYFKHLSKKNRYVMLTAYLGLHPAPHEVFAKLLSQDCTISDDQYYHCLKNLAYRINAVEVFEELTAKRELDPNHPHFDQTISRLFVAGLNYQIELSCFIFQKYRAFFIPEKVREVLSCTNKNLVLFLLLTGYKLSLAELNTFCDELLENQDPNNHLPYFISNYSQEITDKFITSFLNFLISKPGYAQINIGCIATLSYSRPNELSSFFGNIISGDDSRLIGKINSLFKIVTSMTDVALRPVISDVFLNNLLMQLEKAQHSEEAEELAQQIKAILMANASRKTKPLVRSLEENQNQSLIPMPAIRFELPNESSPLTVVAVHSLPIFELPDENMDLMDAEEANALVNNMSM